MATIIKGNWNEKDAEVRAAQSGPFVFISSNGSGRLGDVAQLLEDLAEYPLDPTFEKYGDFITLNPCEGVRNLEYRKVEGANEWIDGPRIFNVDGVVHFFGNFFGLSHAFSIDTNDAETINELTEAIRANQRREDYISAKVSLAA